MPVLTWRYRTQAQERGSGDREHPGEQFSRWEEPLPIRSTRESKREIDRDLKSGPGQCQECPAVSEATGAQRLRKGVALGSVGLAVTL